MSQKKNRIKVISQNGNSDWVEDAACRIKEVLDREEIPESGEMCDYCKFVMWGGKAERGGM